MKVGALIELLKKLDPKWELYPDTICLYAREGEGYDDQAIIDFAGKLYTGEWEPWPGPDCNREEEPT